MKALSLRPLGIDHSAWEDDGWGGPQPRCRFRRRGPARFRKILWTVSSFQPRGGEINGC